MKEIELFHLTHCPYCVNAGRAIEELKREDPAYAEIRIRWIEESEEPELADSRDYYYVPTIYCGGEKLYEARPTHGYETIKKHVRAALDMALGR
ncbi:MAG: glutaredoxin [Oscillospiraceae bacterium]|nr:glutaredoxin [Oscillospiraceae bacterium]